MSAFDDMTSCSAIKSKLDNVFAVLFFVALAFAGLTSSVSLVEPMVQYFIDRFKWSRLKASVAMGLFFYLLGIIALLSNIDGLFCEKAYTVEIAKFKSLKKPNLFLVKRISVLILSCGINGKYSPLS